MPSLSADQSSKLAFFDSFDNLDSISADAIAAWLKPVPETSRIENYLANKILYPQTVAQTEYEMQMDLAILREALKIHAPQNPNALLGGNPFLNEILRKILIPAKFLSFVPDLETLVCAFIDAFLLERKKKDFFTDLWTVVLTDDADEIAGSVILPDFTESQGVVRLTTQGKNYQVLQGTLTVVPCPRERCEIFYRIQKGKILGKEESALEVSGGRLGLVIDGRRL